MSRWWLCLVLPTHIYAASYELFPMSLEESTELYTGKVRYGVSREDGPDKIGTHAITYDKDRNIIMKILAKPNATRNSIGVCGSLFTVTTRVERLGLRIAAPSIPQEANEEMLKYLAKVLRTEVENLYISEDDGYFKTIKVAAKTMTIEDLLQKLMRAQNNPSYMGQPDYGVVDYIDDSQDEMYLKKSKLQKNVYC